MSALLPLTKFARVALAAAVVAVSAAGALPAQARPFTQPVPHHYFVHPFSQPFFHPYPYFPVYPQPYYYPQQVCLPDWQLRRSVEDQGYYDVTLYASTGIYAHGRASRAGRSYLITVNRCDGDVVSVQRAY
jgi:hypothetical protein